MKIKLLLLYVSIFWFTLLSITYGQLPQTVNLPNNIPPSPVAAALGLYGEVSSNNYSGQVNVDVPLYKYTQGNFDLDMKLSYLSSGLRYLDEASTVGLGWSLNGFGIITRNVRGQDDIASTGYSKSSTPIDGEPDLFYYNFNGRAGKFILPYSGGLLKARVINQTEDMLIYLDTDDNFVAQVADGTLYKFNLKEDSYVSNGTNPEYRRTTSWHLSEIVLSNKEKITIKYTTTPKKIITRSVQLFDIHVLNINIMGGGSPQCHQQIRNSIPTRTSSGGSFISKVDEVLISKVSGKNGEIDFLYEDRDDIETTSGKAKRLESVQIKTKGNVLRKFKFEYQYFSAADASSHLGKRLKLESVKEFGGITSNYKVHRFSYYEGSIPSKSFVTGSYYGFFSSNPLATMLQKVTYPTGGYTEFLYENHDYSIAAQGTVVPNSELGVRLKNYTNYDKSGIIALNRTFQYVKRGSNQQISSGKLLSRIKNGMTTQDRSGTFCENVMLTVIVDKAITYRSSIASLGGSGTVVGYDQVNIIDTGVNESNGKRELFFHNSVDVYVGLVAGAQGTNDFKNGTLLQESIYAWDKVAKKYDLRKSLKHEYSYVDENAFDGKIVSFNAQSTYKVNVFKSRIRNTREMFKEKKLDSLVTLTEFAYTNNYLQPSVVSFLKSTGEISKLKKKYPYDFVGVYPYDKMTSAYYLTPIVEEINEVDGVETFMIRNKYLMKSVGSEYLFPLESTDSKYLNSPVEERMLFTNFTLNGKPQQVRLAGGPAKSYQWSVNGEFPVVEITNANNNDVKYLNENASESLNFPTETGNSRTTTFTTTHVGNIEVKLYPGTFLASSTTFYVDYRINGPLSSSGYFCMNNSPGQYCYSHNKDANTYTIANAQPGTYTLTVSPTVSIPNSAAFVIVTYPKASVVEPALKEFFYEGFEENDTYFNNSSIYGSGCKVGDYQVPFIVPNSRGYAVDYRYFQNGKWNFRSRSFQNNMTLSDGDAIDEVRVYPLGSQMSTYTYSPLVGMTSKTDSKGMTEFYEYDSFQRLRFIKDSEGNIIKAFDYHYKGQ